MLRFLVLASLAALAMGGGGVPKKKLMMMAGHSMLEKCWGEEALYGYFMEAKMFAKECQQEPLEFTPDQFKPPAVRQNTNCQIIFLFRIFKFF